MSGQNFWELLELAPTGNKKSIKKAYARKCRTCHPEEHPEEFERLHQAYEKALDYASRTGEDKEPKTPFLAEDFQPGQREQSKDSEAFCCFEIPAEKWEELLNQETEEEKHPASLPLEQGVSKPEAIRQPQDRVDTEILLDQMKELEALCQESAFQSEQDYPALMERWDALAESELFREYGHSPFFTSKLFAWLEQERGELHMPTMIGLCRIYHVIEMNQVSRWKLKQWKNKRAMKKYPEIRFLMYEIIGYDKVWERDVYAKQLFAYGMSPQKVKKEKKRTENNFDIWAFLSENRRLWKGILAVLLAIRFLSHFVD